MTTFTRIATRTRSGMSLIRTRAAWLARWGPGSILRARLSGRAHRAGSNEEGASRRLFFGMAEAGPPSLFRAKGETRGRMERCAGAEARLLGRAFRHGLSRALIQKRRLRSCTLTHLLTPRRCGHPTLGLCDSYNFAHERR